MSAAARIQELLESARQPFDVLGEFSSLSSKRKMLLCDHLFIHKGDTFQKTVNLLWPEATDADVKKLAGFLETLRQKAH
ncbi:MAG: hypothetical protein AAF244_04335 [Pseudomonadota bacterium]